jgi:hypothetical protein
MRDQPMGLRQANISRAVEDLFFELQAGDGYDLNSQEAAALMRHLLCPSGIRTHRIGVYFSCLRAVGNACRRKIRRTMWAAGQAGEWGDYYRYNLRLLTVWRWVLLLALYGVMDWIGVRVNIEPAIDGLAELVSRS